MWIEITDNMIDSTTDTSQPARAVWIEIIIISLIIVTHSASQPARAVWIEI